VAPPQQQQQPRPTPATGNTPAASQDSFLSPEAREKALTELTDMGFERTQAELALRASFYHVERAAEYLITVKLRKIFFLSNFQI
jgi:UV excision repair protein RAD23